MHYRRLDLNDSVTLTAVDRSSQFPECTDGLVDSRCSISNLSWPATATSFHQEYLVSLKSFRVSKCFAQKRVLVIFVDVDDFISIIHQTHLMLRLLDVF